MPAKLKAGGATVRSLTEEKLREAHARGGKQGHKARMELIRRGLIDANYTAVVPVIELSA